VTFFLARAGLLDDSQAMPAPALSELPFLQNADELLDLMEVMNALTPRVFEKLPSEDKASIAAEIVTYCNQYRSHALSRQSQNPRRTLLKLRQLYNL
jgi:hypothetical protein